jgi:hypothetical protein
VVTINWGDGIRSTGIVAANASGGFTVTGSHAYGEEGSYAVTVQVADAGGSSANASSAATVGDAALSAIGMSLSATEGTPITAAVATFTDADPNGIASDYVVTINWGDGIRSTGIVAANASGGFTVTGSHAYSEEGSKTVAVTISDAGGSTATVSGTATVADAALRAAGTTLTAIEGASLTPLVASFTDADANALASDYVAAINWGDGSTSIGTVTAAASGGFSVTGTHTYAEEGGYQASITITDAGGSSVAVSSHVAVADANLHAQGRALSASDATGFSGTVATFTDSDPAGVAGDYVATINWGDGTTSIGAVTGVAGGFAVSGSHSFGQGVFTITTSIADAGGASAVATSTFTVDLTPPDTTATVIGTLHHNGWWFTADPGTLTLFATDNLTGVAAIYFTINGGAPQLYTGPLTLAQGKYVITYWAVDGAGNVEPADTIMIDVTGRKK